MKKIATILFGTACFIVGAITTIVMFLKTLLSIDSIRDSFIAALKKEITDNVYALFYGCKPKYKVKYQGYSNYYRKKEDASYIFGKALDRIDYMKNIPFKTYDKAENVVCEIRKQIDDYGYATINDIASIMGHHWMQFYGGDKWGYDDQFRNMFKVNPDGKFGHWTIDIAYNPIRLLNRE